MIEDFSEGYYLARMYVHRDSSGPSIAKELYDIINNELYATDGETVTMRLGFDSTGHFDVSPGDEIPVDVLALPPTYFDDDGLRNVFILKPDHAPTVGEYHG